MLAVGLVLISQTGKLAAAPEAVIRARGLPAIGVVVGAGQAAGHIGVTVIVLQQAIEGVYLVRRIFAFQHHVVDTGVAVFAPVAAACAGVEQGRAETVIRRSAYHQVVRLFWIVLRRGGAELPFNAGFNTEILRNRAGHEVHHAAHALRPIAHRAAAAHHVNGIHIAQRDRRERQLRLTVWRKRYGDAVHQYRRAAGQAWVKAANTEVHRQVMAAGAVVFRGVDAGDTVQRFAHGRRAGFGEIIPADNVTRAGMFEHVVFPGFTQPVADYGQRVLAGNRGGFQRPGVIA